ncbi:hypothetical protein DFR35_0356 [Sulfurisoma sediminicola]|jgi:hypothetical protein|uniref:Uncharacterized protein n=1 Tax=Sulfurisoma sediminicola TaxID=1381557 RepID=A0A497XKJ9_9PROT|nr:hypothetical protein DFR35_0356 [Sulfurisoma sediminicola]
MIVFEKQYSIIFEFEAKTMEREWIPPSWK